MDQLWKTNGIKKLTQHIKIIQITVHLLNVWVALISLLIELVSNTIIPTLSDV